MSRPCEICGNEIATERIECVPETRLCIEHARMMQKYGGEFIITGIQESIGKVGSLKKNYGGISTSKRRNIDGVFKLRQELGGATTDG
jgi:hypothetical protein